MTTFAFSRAVIGAVLVSGITVSHADSITLDQAVRRAANRPAVAIAGTEVDAVRAEAAGARRPIYNPELGVAVGPRFGGGQTLLDAEVSLAQTIELGGKRDARRAVADARVAAAGSNLVQAQLDAEFEVWRAFQLTLLARARIDATREAEALATQLVTASSDRQALGAGTQLQINLATLEGGRARHDRLDAENAYDAALAELARVIGAAPDERLEPVGELATLPAAALDEDALVARAEVRLANAEATPNLTASVSYGYEQDLDTDFHAVMAGLSISLPVRNRNQGARSAARARVRGAELEQDRRTVDVEREVRVAIRAYARAREALLGFDREINERLHDNLELAHESFVAGKLDYFEFSVVRRDLVANRLAFLDAATEAVDAWSTVQRAVGKGDAP